MRKDKIKNSFQKYLHFNCVVGIFPLICFCRSTFRKGSRKIRRHQNFSLSIPYLNIQDTQGVVKTKREAPSQTISFCSRATSAKHDTTHNIKTSITEINKHSNYKLLDILRIKAYLKSRSKLIQS